MWNLIFLVSVFVKNIKGGISGESKVLYENGEVGLIGEYTIRQGSFVLNNNRFKIDNAEIRFPEQSTGSTLQIDPFIVFNASTKVGKEELKCHSPEKWAILI